MTSWRIGPLEAQFLVLLAIVLAGLIGGLFGAGSGWDRDERDWARTVEEDRPKSWRRADA